MKAGVFYLKACADISEHGNHDIKLGEYYLKKNEWGLAIKTIRKGIGKGGLYDPGRAHKALGDAYLLIGKCALAEDEFEVSRGYLGSE